MRLTILPLAIASTCLIVLASQPAAAGSLSVANHDFEDMTLADNGSTTSVIPTSWSAIGGAATGISFGYFNPTDFRFPGTTGEPGINGTMSGPNIFYFGSLADGQGIQQELADKFEANTDYTVTVALGNREFGTVSSILGVELIAGTTPIATAMFDSADVPAATFEDRSLNYAFDAADTGLVGSALTLRLKKIAVTGRPELDIDNIRIGTLRVVPEPASLALQGLLGFMLLLLWRRVATGRRAR